jgi:glycogen debranching enzyme
LPVSLPARFRLVADDQARVVRACRRHLLTAFGLRSLAPGSRAYHPGYGGGVLERDGGYHQGPVWGWLLGSFSLADYRVSDNATAAKMTLACMRDAMEDQAMGTIGEIFDGDPPTIRAAPRCRLGPWPARSTPGAS